MYLNIIKAEYDKLTANITILFLTASSPCISITNFHCLLTSGGRLGYLHFLAIIVNGGKVEAIPLQSGTRHDCALSLLLLQIDSKTPSNKAKQENEMDKRNQTIYICK